MGRLFEDQVVSVVRRALDAGSMRHQAISHNLANANTPGYKRLEVRFEDDLRRALADRGRQPVPLVLTHPRHLGTPSADPGGVAPRVLRDTASAERADGNNVTLEAEMIRLAENQLWYDALARQISRRFLQWQSVIFEGRR